MSRVVRIRQGRWAFLAGLLAAAAPPTWAAKAPGGAKPLPRVTLTTQETPLGTFPDDLLGGSVTVDATSRRVAYAVFRGAAGLPPMLEAARGSGTMAAVIDGRKGKPHALIDGPFFSPDGRRVAYAAMSFRQLRKAGGVRISQEGARMVVDGVEGKAHDEIRNRQFPRPVKDGERPIFSPDSRRLAYVARIKRTWRVVVDGREDKTYDGVLEDSLRFSPDSRHYAYAAKRGDKQVLVLNGAEVGTYERVSVGSMLFSPESSRLAYGAERKGKIVLVTVGAAAGAKATETVTPLFSPVFRFSPDGKRLACILRSDGGERIVLEGKPLEQYEEVRPPVFGPKGKRFGFLARRGGRSFAVIDGKAQPGYEHVYALHFSPDGKHSAYVTEQGKKWRVVIDGKPGPACDGIMAAESFFSPDGERNAYVLRRGNKAIAVIDGVEGRPYDNIMPIKPMFSPDGKRIAYSAVVGKKVGMIVDGRAGRLYDRIGEAVFSPDSKYLAYTACRGKERFVVVRGAESKPCENFVSGSVLTLDGPDSLHTLGGRGNAYFRVDVKITEVGTTRPARQPKGG